MPGKRLPVPFPPEAPDSASLRTPAVQAASSSHGSAKTEDAALESTAPYSTVESAPALAWISFKNGRAGLRGIHPSGQEVLDIVPSRDTLLRGSMTGIQTLHIGSGISRTKYYDRIASDWAANCSHQCC